MKSLSTKKIIIAILSVLFAFCMMAGLTANKVSANTDLETVTLKTTMDQSAQMRLTNPTGMRFITIVDEDDVDLFGDDIQVVTMITQKNLLDDANIEVADFNKDSAVKMATVEFNKYNLEDALAVHGSYKLTATILEISDANIAKTYVAKTYITDGEKIGYVGGATEASIYDVATEALKNVNPAEEPENYEVLLGYTKSCNIVINGNAEEPVEVPYGSKLIDTIFYGIPECYTVVSIKDANSNDVAKDFVVTEDIALTIELAENHVWKDGECALGCGAICYHPEYDGCTCKTCGQEKAHEYNATGICSVCGKIENAVVWGSMDGAYVETVEFNGEKVTKYVTTNDGSGKGNNLTTSYTNEYKYIMAEFFVETFTEGILPRFYFRANGQGIAGDVIYFKADGNKNTEWNGWPYAKLPVGEWFTAIIPIPDNAMPADGESYTLTLNMNGGGAFMVTAYVKNARFTNYDVSVKISKAGVRNGGYATLTEKYNTITGKEYTWTVNNVEEGKTAHNYYSSMYIDFTPITAATVTFDITLVKQTGDDAFNFAINTVEDSTSGERLPAFTLSEGETKSITISITGSTGTFSRMFIYGGEGNTGGIVTISNLTYTPVA